MILKTKLKQYQKEAVKKLSKIKVGALFMEMGTGKTRVSLELIKKRLDENKINYILWLCPYSVKQNLKEDIEKHTINFKNYEIHGIESLSSSIKLISKLIKIVKDKNVYLIVDESSLIKNHKAIRSKRIEYIARNCKYKLILNGTPITKSESDLFWQWFILDWRILGYKSFWSFSANHLVYDEKGRIVKTLDTDYLSKKIMPYTFQVKKNDVLELPNKSYYTECFNQTFEQEEEYYRTANDYFLLIDEFKPSTIYRAFTALQHIVSGRRLINKTYNRMKTVPMFEDFNNPRIQCLLNVLTNDKTIIFCKYKHEIMSLNKVIDNSVIFDGSLNLKKRIEALESFKNDKKYLIANKNTLSYGLNLQFCNKIIFYSNDWDFGTRIQAEDRVYRIGQEKKVTITDIICNQSIDWQIYNSLLKKEDILESFKNYIKQLKNKLTLL